MRMLVEFGHYGRYAAGGLVAGLMLFADIHGSAAQGGQGAQGADLLRGPIRGGFSVAEADRETGARKYALWGESATPLTAEEWEIQSPRLELYGADGTTNLVFMPSRCNFSRKTQRITSSEALRMWTGDGNLRMQGEGFALDLEARRLWVSNRVEAVINKALFQKKDGLEPVRGAVGSGVILVRSDRLEYGSNRVEFLDGVRAEDADGHLECRRLVVDLVADSSDVRALGADGAVRFAAAELQVQAGEAVYEPAEGRLTLTGEPHWVFRQRPGRARVVVLDRDRRAFSAEGEVRMELPAESFSVPAFSGVKTNAVRGAQGEGPVLVLADRMTAEPQPGQTNRHNVVLRGGVTIQQGEGRLRSREFLVQTEGEEHTVRRAEATGEVTIERGLERMSCERAEYDAAGAYAEFSGGVGWQTRDRSGSADRVWLDLAENHYRAEGAVRMRFEQAGGSWGGWLLPGEETGSDGTGVSEGAVAGAEPTEIECDRFAYRGGRGVGAVPSAEYEGNVVVKQGDQLHMTCNSLRAQFDAGTNQVRSVVAEERVELRAADGSGYRLARGDRAVYSAVEDEVLLTGREGVEFFVIGPSGVSRGMGRQAVYQRATDSLVLAGDPAITTPEGELRGSEVRLDRREGVLSATGPWWIRLPVGRGELPRLPVP
jgi:lipopolysaccharide export system protein LptA